MAYIQRRRYYNIGLLALGVLLFLSVLFSCSVGAANITMVDAFKILIWRIPVIGQKIVGDSFPGSSITIIWTIRFPRILLSMFAGAALAFSGTTYQGLFRNPMAEPYVLGVSAGAALGGTLSIILGITAVMGMAGAGAMAFIGAVIAAFVVYILGMKQGRASMTYLILAGVAINSLLSSIISFLMILNKQKLERIILWTMGSFSAASWDKVIIQGVCTLLGIIIIYCYGRDLNLILLGEENAKYLGVEVEKVKKILLVVSSFISAITVSMTGIIGFVGLIVPHAVRMVVGPDHRALMPYSALVGSIFVVIADTMARTLMPPVEIPVGIITSLFGAPFFLYLLIKAKRKTNF